MHSDRNGFNMFRFVKRHLLYSHRIYIYDTLMPLLDYIRIDPSYEYEEERKKDIIRLVKDYAAIAPLLQRNIVIPICLDTVRPSLNECMLSNDEDNSLKRISKTDSSDDVNRVIAYHGKRARLL